MKKFEKGKRLNYNSMSFRELIIAFFAHWTGYASNGWKTGISSNPTAGRLEDYLLKHFPDTWGKGYYSDGMHDKLMHKVMEICNKVYPIDSSAPIYVRKQMEKAWPEVEKFLETTPLIDDDTELSENISLDELKECLKESRDDETILDIISSLKNYKCPKDLMKAFEVEMMLDDLGDRLKDAYERESGYTPYERNEVERLSTFFKDR